MEPPVQASGTMFRRAASFSHRQERALKDINGRVNLLNKSQELISKDTMDGQKMGRPAKRYSAVASRYASTTATKKQISPIFEAPSGGHTNMTKLPFITGRTIGHHERKPSSENLKSFQPPIVFTATSRDVIPKPTTTTNHVTSAKRPRFGKRNSMIEKSPKARAPRFLSLDKGGCSCSKNSFSGNSASAVLPGSVSLLNSAPHWLSLIKLAEVERKHKVVIDLFRLAISLKAEPIEEITANLRRYQASYPNDQTVSELLQQCEDLHKEVEASEISVSKAVAPSNSDGTSVGKIVVVPPVVPQIPPPAKKEAAVKPAAAMGRRLSRSSTFSCVDTKSQAAKVTYGKKLAKTVEDLPAPKESDSQTGNFNPAQSGQTVEFHQHTPFVAKDEQQVTTNSVEATTASTQCSTNVGGVIHQEHVQASEGDSPPLTDQSLVLMSGEALEQACTPTLKVSSSVLDQASKLDEAPPLNCSTPAVHMGPTTSPELPLVNGSAEKPVDSLSEWLDGEASEMGTPDIQSAPTEPTVDLSPSSRGATVAQMDVDSLMKEVVSCILPEDGLNSTPEIKETEVQPPTAEFHIRRKSWHEADLTMVEEDENVVKSHRHSLSAEAVLLSVPGSVVEKVKMFTELAVVSTATGQTDRPAKSEGSKDLHVAGGVRKPTIVKDEHKNKQTKGNETLETPAKLDSKPMPSEGTVSKQGARTYTRQKSLKGENVPLPPGAATPSELASVGTRRTRNRRGSIVDKLTPTFPREGTPDGECTESSPSEDSFGQCGSSTVKRMSRGHKEVTPRYHLPKPSWRAIVEREMKGSKLKELLAGELPKETSPLADFVEAQMESQRKESESAIKEKTVDYISPIKTVRKLTRSSSKRQANTPKPAPVEVRSEIEGHSGTGQKPKNQESQAEVLESNTAECTTPGSAMRRSARIQNKVQSRRNNMFKDEFVYMK